MEVFIFATGGSTYNILAFRQKGMFTISLINLIPFFKEPICKSKDKVDVSKKWEAKRNIACKIESRARVLLPLAFAIFALTFSVIVTSPRIVDQPLVDGWSVMESKSK